MDKLLYVAMSGAKQTMLGQAVNSQNMANINTGGFKEDFTTYQSMLANGTGLKTRAYPILENTGINFSEGTQVSTGRDLDLAVQGNGFIAVQGENGQEGYTREGSLRILPNGLLVNSRGQFVLGNSGAPVSVPPHDGIDIGTDGTITIVPTGQDPSALATVDRIKLVSPALDNLRKGSDGLFYSKDTSVQPPDAGVNVMSGFLESSNVNAMNSMVNMIEQARLFEMDVKMMRTAQEMDTKSTELLRLA